jgi:hypothetical protein
MGLPWTSLGLRQRWRCIRRVTKFGLVGLVWTYEASWEFPGTPIIGSLMLHAKFEVPWLDSLAVGWILGCIMGFAAAAPSVTSSLI